MRTHTSNRRADTGFGSVSVEHLKYSAVSGQSSTDWITVVATGGQIVYFPLLVTPIMSMGARERAHRPRP
jgi:hypothetical protein